MKKIFTTIIVIIALGGAIVLVYLALGKKNDQTVTTTPTNLGLLPQGTSLDFSKLKDFNKDNRLFPYPTVTPPEIGASGTAIVP